MKKSLYIAEKPSVAIAFSKALKTKTTKHDGYIESDEAVITWCVGHLISMSYPEKYDQKLKKWNLETLPFLPKKYKYEVISNVKKQFTIVKRQLTRQDVDVIYICTDSGREGEYIYRLVDQMVGINSKTKKRVWIDSQTEEEIIRGIKEAKPLDEYNNLAESAYLRAKEDYLIGINFSRLLTLKYGPYISRYLGSNYTVIAVGRVMTCVLGMVVNREIEIRKFVKMPFYKIIAKFIHNDVSYEGEWKVTKKSKYYNTATLYKDIGFKKEEEAKEFISWLKLDNEPIKATLEKITKKKEKKYAPLLYNLAELQNECSKRLKLSPDETLKIAQELYEKKLITYPRTDARVISTAVSKEIFKNIKGLINYPSLQQEAQLIITDTLYKNISKSKYVNDKMITDHYAIIPTGQGTNQLQKCTSLVQKVYELIARRFVAIFYPPAIFQKLLIETSIKGETFFSSFKACLDRGFLDVLNQNDSKKDILDITKFSNLKKGINLTAEEIAIKQGETTPPKRYNSGTIILAMENAGQLIENDELREQIKGSGIGTSATRAEILKKLIHIKYISLNKKTQIIMPTGLGEMIYKVVIKSIKSLINPELTASWEKGLNLVADGKISSTEYMSKLESYISKNTRFIKEINNQTTIIKNFDEIPQTLLQDIKKTVKKNRKHKGIGKCIVCETGIILENKKAFYCSNWRTGCKMTIWKNSLNPYGQQVTKELIQKLFKNKIIKDIDIILPQTQEKGIADIEFRKDNTGALEIKNFKRI